MPRLREALSHSLRRVRHRRGVAFSVILVLGVGIGVATAALSVVERVLLQAIPAPELDRLLVAWQAEPARDAGLIEVSYPFASAWRAENRSFAEMAAFGSVNWSFELQQPAPRERVAAAYVSASFFDALRVRPRLGRTFLPREEEPDAERVLVLSHGLWQRRFGSDPGVVGAQVFSGETAFTIVGVMPEELDFPAGAELWTPLGPALDRDRVRRGWSPRFFRSLGVLYVLGRLKDGVSLRSAEADLSEISRRLSIADSFSVSGGWSARTTPLVDHHLGTSTRQALQALGAASVFVLLLACANAAVLLLVQAIRDRSDLAVRRAVGAATWDVVAQLVLDASLLVLAGGAAGGLVAWGSLHLASALGPSGIPGLSGSSVVPDGFGLALAGTVAVALGVTLAPAWLASRLELSPLLRGGRAGLDWRGLALTRLIVVSEVALSVVLLVGSGLTLRSLHNLLKLELGFRPERALTLSLDFAKEKYPTPREDRAFHRAVVERLAALPGVEAAGAVHNRPLEHGPIGSDNSVIVEGDALDEASVMSRSLTVNWQAATPDYFRAVGTRLVEGRGFSERDSAEAPRVVVVSRSLARRAWPGASPLGKRLHTYPARTELKHGVYTDIEWMTVVGVVEDARYRGLQEPRLDLYLPYGQVVDALHHVVVRTHADPLAQADAVRNALRELDADARVAELTTLQRLVDRALAPWRLASGLLTGFALIALLLTASGLFAVLHHFVSGRTHEIAIRMALGADAARVRRFVLSQGLGVTGLGIVLGGASSLALARALSALLYGLDALDPWSHFASVSLIGLVAVGAALLPARRAARVDATVALRSE